MVSLSSLVLGRAGASWKLLAASAAGAAQPPHPTPPQRSLPVWRLAVLSALCAEATDESERLAEAGEIDASMAVVQTAERLRAEHERLAKKYTEPERYIMGEHAVHVL